MHVTVNDIKRCLVKMDVSKEDFTLGALLNLAAQIRLTVGEGRHISLCLSIQGTGNRVFIENVLGCYFDLEEHDSVSSYDEFYATKTSCDTTFLFRTLHADTGKTIYLRPRQNYYLWALNFRRQLQKRMITVALRNVPGTLNNANMKEWFLFFEDFGEKYPQFKFVLLGNDKFDFEYSTLSNVVRSKDLKLTLPQELALIHSSELFLGTCSGFFNAALFSAVPYLVFKNPLVHQQQMIDEIGDKTYYSFASHKQYIVRGIEDSHALKEMVEWILGYKESVPSLLEEVKE